MRRIRRRIISSFTSSILIIALTTFSIIWLLNEKVLLNGVGIFCYFTILSNILLAVTCICEFPSYFVSLRVSNSKCSFVGTRLPEGTLLPKWVIVLKEVGVTSTTLTMLIALTLLAYTKGIAFMLQGPNLLLHLVNPVLGIISFCFFDFGEKIRMRTTPISLAPVIIYGFVYLYNVLILGPKHGGWPDFYGFNSGMLDGLWYVAFPCVVLITYILTMILFGLHGAGTKVKLSKH